MGEAMTEKAQGSGGAVVGGAEDGAAGMGRGEEGACYVRDAEELAASVEDASLGCETIVLTNLREGAYELTREIVISRSVLIRGNSAALPLLDAGEIERAFRVTPSGYLEMRYVRILPGNGIIRERIPGEPSSGQVSKCLQQRWLVDWWLVDWWLVVRTHCSSASIDPHLTHTG